MSADYIIDPNAGLRELVLAVERYTTELTQHIAFAGDGPDSYAFAVAIEIHQGLISALAGQTPNFMSVAFVGHRNISTRRAVSKAYEDGFSDGRVDGLVYRTQEGEGSDV